MSGRRGFGNSDGRTEKARTVRVAASLDENGSLCPGHARFEQEHPFRPQGRADIGETASQEVRPKRGRTCPRLRVMRALTRPTQRRITKWQKFSKEGQQMRAALFCPRSFGKTAASSKGV